MSHTVYFVPFLKLFNWLKKRSRPPVRPDTMINAAIEATASSSGKKRYRLSDLSRRLEVQQCVTNHATGRTLLATIRSTYFRSPGVTSVDRLMLQWPSKYGVGISECDEYVDVMLKRCRDRRSRALLTADKTVLTGVCFHNIIASDLSNDMSLGP